MVNLRREHEQILSEVLPVTTAVLGVGVTSYGVYGFVQKLFDIESDPRFVLSKKVSEAEGHLTRADIAIRTKILNKGISSAANQEAGLNLKAKEELASVHNLLDSVSASSIGNCNLIQTSYAIELAQNSRQNSNDNQAWGSIVFAEQGLDTCKTSVDFLLRDKYELQNGTVLDIGLGVVIIALAFAQKYSCSRKQKNL